MPEVKLRYAQRFGLRVNQPLFENKMLVLHKRSDFFFLGRRINLITFFDLKTHSGQLVVRFAPNLIIISLICKFDMLVLMWDDTPENLDRVLCPNALFGNTNKNVEHPMIIVVARVIQICVELHQK